jgi:ATP-dependent Lon protease
VGGIKEKVLAAYRSGIKHVLLPKPNERDLQDVPKEALRAVKVTLTEDVSENVKAAMAEGRTKKAKASQSAKR